MAKNKKEKTSTQNPSKTDNFVKLTLVFFISLLSFSVGTFVGKKFSDNQHKVSQMKPKLSNKVSSIEIKENEVLTEKEIENLPNKETTEEPTPQPRLPASLPSLVSTHIGKYTVQIASYASELDAKKRSKNLRNKGFSAFYIPAQIKGKTWYRVNIGLFQNRKEASFYRQRIAKQAGIKTSLIQKISRQQRN